MRLVSNILEVTLVDDRGELSLLRERGGRRGSFSYTLALLFSYDK